MRMNKRFRDQRIMRRCCFRMALSLKWAHLFHSIDKKIRNKKCEVVDRSEGRDLQVEFYPLCQLFVELRPERWERQEGTQHAHGD